MRLEGFEALPEIRSMGVCLFDPVWSERAHETKVNEFLYVRKGRVKLEIGGAKFAAGPGDMLFVPARTQHRDEFDIRSELEVFMIFFSWAAERDFFGKVSNAAIKALSKSERDGILKLVDMLREDFLGHEAMDSLISRSRMHTMLLSLLRAVSKTESGSAESASGKAGDRKRRKLMLEAKRFLEGHYMERLSLEDIAAHLSVSPFHLSHVFSRESNFSLFEYLTSLRMERAKLLIEEGRMNVSEAAFAVGYENFSYFSKSFKRHFGRSPSSFACCARVERPVSQ